MPLAGADSATPKPTEYSGRKIWGVYVAGDTFHVWTREEVDELRRYGVEGVMPIVVPPQDKEWWLEGVGGYPTLDELVREAKRWGVPKGAPLCLDIEQHQSDRMANKTDVAHAWAVASRGHGFRTWTYSGRDYLASDPYGFKWLADWDDDPTIPQGFNAHQYASDDAKGIDHDVFEAGRDYMEPGRAVVIVDEPSEKSHAASSASDSTESGEKTSSADAPVTAEGGASDTSAPPSNLERNDNETANSPGMGDIHSGQVYDPTQPSNERLPMITVSPLLQSFFVKFENLARKTGAWTILINDLTHTFGVTNTDNLKAVLTAIAGALLTVDHVAAKKNAASIA